MEKRESHEGISSTLEQVKNFLDSGAMCVIEELDRAAALENCYKDQN